ncbi:MAG TPA: phytanoyl-CoA dioxygenase family protein [Terracidiphilus sp.]|nr:phytanoyl-CoA dioxygenase family protein [Terracidiphilus sp.]
MQTASTFRDLVIAEGFAIVPQLLSRDEIGRLILTLEALADSESILKRGGMFAVRNLLDVSAEVRALAESRAVREVIEEILGGKARPVRGILFDKTPDANWKVPWHQDVTIAVAERSEADGFGPWSLKAGVLHVQPPAFILERMLSIRIHLDPCGAENGALKVLPGSHRFGRLPEADIARLVTERPGIVCEAEQGDALLMRPLLLHASSSSANPAHRRVVHIDYASIELPNGLRWATESACLPTRSSMVEL